MTNHLHPILTLTTFLLAVWIVAPTAATADTTHSAELVEAAKKEGHLTWYTAMNIRDAGPILDEFKKKYPFVKTNMISATGERLINRVTTEVLAGKWLFDVVSTNGVAVLHDKLLPYMSPESAAFDKEFKDPEGRWTGYDHNYYVFAYNSSMVSEKEAPKSYEDLLLGKWRQKIVIDPEDYEWYGTLVATWGREKTDRYLRQLAKQDIQWRKGHSLIAQLIVAGEFPIGLPYANGVDRVKKRGAPIDWIDSMDPIVTGLNAIGIGAGSKNPNTAKLFVDFLLSKRGQEMIRDAGRLPARSDVKPLSAKSDPARLKLRQVPREVYENISEYAERFRKIFGL